MCGCYSCGRWIPVLFVLSVIGSCYVVFTLDVLLQLLLSADPLTHTTGIWCTVVFNVLFGFGTISFMRTVYDEPGTVPAAWVVGADEEEEASTLLPPSLPVLETKHDGSRRICRKSTPNIYKPDRAHFCRQLGRCVLKMDHFCPWTNSCIGFGNHKFFLLFVFYMTACDLFVVVSLAHKFAKYLDAADRDFSRLASQEEFRVSLVFLTLCLLGAALVPFFWFHAYLVTANYTTIEFLEKRGCNPPPDHVNRYHLGLYRNLESVLGRNPLFWFIPVRWFNDGDGLAYELNPAWVSMNKSK